MIKSATVKNFMGFQTFKANGFSPINVFIGKNDTGKTALLKLLYTTLATIDMYSRRSKNEEVNLKKLLAEKMANVFLVGKKGLGELVNKSAREKLIADFEYSHSRLGYEDRLHFTFGESTTNTIVDCQEKINTIHDSFRAVFIPAKEVLTPLKAIRATRDNYHIPGFDDTYLDLIRALVVPTQKGNITAELKEVNRRLDSLFDGRIEQGHEDEFLFKKGNTEFQISLTAEGIKKIGILTTLIRNMQLNANSVLFMDEPETALHPEAVRELVEMLISMAKSGIQLFIATHNYFVLKQMHICARRDQLDASCFSLQRDEKKHINYNSFNLMTDFPETSIVEAALKMADEEIRMDIGI